MVQGARFAGFGFQGSARTRRPALPLRVGRVLPFRPGRRAGRWAGPKNRTRPTSCTGVKALGGSKEQDPPYFVYTVPVADNPGFSRWSGSAPGSRASFTGTRCTTLTKLPVAFSAG